VEADQRARRHHPGLDGVRGAGVAAVLCFHGGFSWAKGGYLGVSTFFTLSGFLITGLLIGERAERGAIRLVRFWERRFRRLLPAMVLTVVVVAAFSAWVADGDQLGRIRADGLATLGYVANWRFVFSGQTYAALFDSPSPLLHAWSLAIEEQFYLAFPLLVAGVLRLGRGRRRVLAIVLAVLTVASVAASVALRADHARVYYGTDTRAAELLIGGLLAIWVAGTPDLAGRRRGWVTVLGAIGVAGSAVAWVSVGQSAPRLYTGGFALYGVASAALVAAAIAPGPIRSMLSWSPLRLLGRVSYGAYLFHWPVFLWLTPARTGLDAGAGQEVALLALRLAVTFALTAVSYRFVEQPVRRGQLPRRSAFALAPAAAGLAVVLLVVATVPASAPGALAAEAARSAPFVEPVELVGARRPTAQDPLRVLMVGDSVGYDAEPGIRAALEGTGLAVVSAANQLGFGLTNGLTDWRSAWPRLVTERRPELVVMLLGSWDEGFIATDGVRAYTDVAAEAADLLTAQGAHLLVLGYPITVDRVTREVASRGSVEALAALPQRRPGRVWFRSLDPALTPDGRYVDHLPGPTGSERVRKLDGTHFCPGGAARIGRLVLDAVVGPYRLTEPPSSWRSGPWALDHRYDDPPGACPA
jgi:peptidoglycan/LPS O-acetylase OafA/YrhL